MDEKNLLGLRLSKIMVDFLDSINSVCERHPKAEPVIKADGTPVTALDLELSSLIEGMSQQHFPQTTIYSEEKFSTWAFPLMAIDPLDGTREYLAGRPEWSVSIGLFESEKFSGEGWVYNPSTNELFNSDLKKTIYTTKSVYEGEVSHSEWVKGLYQPYQHTKFHLQPRGSIAYKLGRLAAGKIDFVVSLTPKNIWDVAGGSLLCARSGIKFYSQGKEVKKVEQIYEPPLIWCSSELSSELLELFCSRDKHL